MRGFIILCFASLAVAAPQGYSYATNHAAAGSLGTNAILKDLQAVSAVQSSGFEQSSTGFATSGYAGEQYAAPPQARYLPPTAAGNSASGSYGYAQQQQPIISKRFYLHSAPEEEDAGVDHRHITVGTPRKNYNVVFIKAPAKQAHRAKLTISPAVNEDKTYIYVLDKKTGDAQIETQVLEQPATTAKPEVYFIKYNTNAEAEHAQRTIQSQYDSLGGSTQISNEGTAPVSSVIGSLDAARQAAPAEYSNAGNTYLPPGKYRQ